MTVLKPLNVIAICATFAFLGAIVLGLVGSGPVRGPAPEVQAAAMD